MEQLIQNCNFNLVNREVMNIGSRVIDFIKIFNQISKIDLKHKSIINTEFLKILQYNFTIEELDLSYNLITSLNYFEDLLLKNSFIHTLILSHNKISDIQCFDIILLVNSSLQYLDLSYNDIRDTFPLNSIQENNSLQTLILSHNKISNIHFDLTSNTTLTYLDLSYNSLSNIDFIGENQTLTYLNLDSNKELDDINSLIPLFLNNKLQYLNLNNTSINNLNLFEILQVNSSLLELHLNWCINVKDFKPLNSLVYNTSLTILNLENNSNHFINNGGYKLIEDILLKNSSITSLNLSNNYIKDFSFLSVLQYNSTLTELDISDNYNVIPYENIIGEIFEHNTTLTSLDLSDTNLSNSSFLQKLKNNSTLTSLNLNSHQFENLQSLEEVFKYNSTLTSLKIHYLHFNFYETYWHPLLSLKNNSTLTSLHINLCKITNNSYYTTSIETEILSDILRTNTTLTELVY